jgi:hypothetical protein
LWLGCCEDDVEEFRAHEMLVPHPQLVSEVNTCVMMMMMIIHKFLSVLLLLPISIYNRTRNYSFDVER